MELYVLDDNLQREHVIDRFESLVWAERYSKIGDFELVVQNTPATRTILGRGTKISLNVSNRMMIVDTISDTMNDEGERFITISGESAEAVLKGKNTFNSLLPPKDPQEWHITGTPKYIIEEIISKVSGLTGRSFFSAGSFYPPDTIPYPDIELPASIPVAGLYDTIYEIAKAYNLGLRLVRNPTNAKLYFNVYTGIDRSSAQTTSDAVIFSPTLENVLNTSHLSSNRDSIKFVVIPNEVTGAAQVYSPEIDWSVESADWFGWQGRVLSVSTDATVNSPEWWEAINIAGLEEVEKRKPVEMLDGEVPANSYRYGVEYNLGDYVDLRTEDGITNRMRVSEQIFTDGPEGEKSYPTFELVQFITPGSWADWSSNVEWINATGTWSNPLT